MSSTLFSEKLKIILVPTTIIYAFAILFWFVFRQNPEIFKLKEEVLIVLNETMNALLLLIVPFIFGVIAATTRVMISGLQLRENIKLISASGLMSSFSWLGIKSKVFIALLTPYIAKATDTGDAAIREGSSEFYSMALVAVLVGAFASNLYIFINQKVESLTNGDAARNK
ncbi:hypothetical protein GBN33_02970 [Plesiomonas shigelloides]|uniref:hypothetical protein n=1 Tax=Plesiomonas shigelloides TaxID=703 RepID=UPI00126234AA|nr:hypothetical protein [Plesiomonas shigelloides]KAB7702116.1 hypothetical protein GBN33_02970 [Plesiomonas shigelloides]